MDYHISIIIPVYKVEEYIERCILSVMNQKCEDIRIECILVDDYSPDRSMERAEKLIDHYTGDVSFMIVRHEHNMGQSSARNTGMKHATGKYLFFLDSDDIIDDLCIQNLWDVVKQYPNVQMVTGNYFDKRTGGKGINESRLPKGIMNNYQLLEMYFLSYIPVMVWNSLILREVVVKSNILFREGLLQEDMLWASQLFSNIDSFVFVPEVTLYYEYNHNSTMSALEVDKTRHLPHQLTIIDYLLNSFHNDHFVANNIYIVSELLLVLDVIWKENDQVDKALMRKAFDCRKRLFRMTVSQFRIVLILFGLIMFKPFGLAMKFRLFRKNYHRIRIAIYIIASFFNFLHRRS